MNYPSLPQIQTDRLILRRFRMSDLESYHRHIASDPEVAQAMLWQPDPDIAHTEAVIRKILSRYGSREGYRWAIARKEDDLCIGTISLLRLVETDGSGSFAYMLGKAFWGRGYMTEALRAVFRFAFFQMGLQSLSADHFMDNPASGAVMEKAGMVRAGLLPRKYEKDGHLHDAVLYRITREAWLAGQGSEQ